MARKNRRKASYGGNMNTAYQSPTGGAHGFPASAQGSRTSFAQSGGRSSTFQGGKGGNAYGRRGGGSKGTGSKDRTSLFNGTSATIRNPGGDGTLVPGGFKGAGRLNLPGGASFKGNRGRTNASIVKPHELPPKGFGS